MRVLVIDDNPDHRELIISKVRKAYPDASFQEVIRQTMLEEALRGPAPDVVLTDYRLQWSNGLNVLASMREAFPSVPVLMVTDTGSEEVAAAGLKGGLSDYVLKGELHRLPLAIKESLTKSWLREERRSALERLRVSEERYRTISELSSDYAYSYCVDEQENVTLQWITQAFTRITGYTEDELKGGILPPLVHPEDRVLIEQGRRELLAGRPYAAEFRIVTKDRHVRWLRDVARPVLDARGERVVCVHGAGQDVTDRKLAEEERAQLIREQAARAEAEASERRYRSLAEAIPQIVWTARPDGHLDYFNHRWFEYTGLTEAQTYDREGWRSALHQEDVESMSRTWYEAFTTGQAYDIEGRFRRAADGAYRWNLVRAIPLCEPGGQVIKWFGTCTDIDEQKRSGEAMREAQKLESIGLLAGGVAHDFNNLLTGILGNTSLALEELPESSRVRPLLENVLLASERAADLTRQLLAYSGKGRFFVRPTDISALVREISNLIQSSIPKKVELRLDLEPDLPMVDVDTTQIQQLVMNLVLNGAEAIGEDKVGQVLVSTRLREVDNGFIAGNHFAVDRVTPGNYVAVQVRDNGTGMDPSIRSRIFDPFFTTKFTGRGLGLAAALGIVRGHNGAIRIETEPGRGTMFEVLIPACATREPKPAAEPVSCELYGAGSVLVIDDEAVVRAAAEATLKRYGYTVLLADNGREGVQLFRRHEQQISLVLLDMMMPVMGGEEALREIRAIDSKVPVIGSSGYSESIAKERFGGKGLTAFLEKPYSAQVLADRVKQVMEKGRASMRMG